MVGVWMVACLQRIYGILAISSHFFFANDLAKVLPIRLNDWFVERC